MTIHVCVFLCPLVTIFKIILFFFLLSLFLAPLHPPAGQTTDTGKGDTAAGLDKPDYIAFVLVPIFFLLGLLGVVICHVLKSKGYRCTTEAQDGEEECEEEEKDLELGGGKGIGSC